jgi:hypothetical protein
MAMEATCSRRTLVGSLLLAPAFAGSTKASYVRRVRPQLLRWLESVRYPDEGWGRWKYTRHMYRKYALQASGMAVNVLDTLGALSDISRESKEQAIRFYQSCQDPRDGYFKDPLVTASDRISEVHSWEHIWSQMSGVSGALVKLGGKPLHPAPAKRFIDTGSLPPSEWHKPFDWTNPWLVGEQWSNVVRGYWRALPDGDRKPDHPAIVAAFRGLESAILDPATGYPMKGGCRQMHVGMAGLFKIASAYLEVGRPVPHARAAIDSTLALQRDDGEFGPSSEMTINWDSLWVLRTLDRQLNGKYARTRIAAAGNRCCEALLARYQHEDGGFARKGALCMTEHNSIRVGPALPEGDMLGARMCLECFVYADEWNAAS